jgi:putative DNA primase/helicase
MKAKVIELDDSTRLIDLPHEPGPEKTLAGGIVLRKVSEVESKPIDWLWRGRIASGKVALLTGDPDTGKSFLTCAMAATVSRGFPWPDGATCEYGSVIMISSEDSIEDTIRPRLEAHDADLDKVHFIESVNRGRKKDCWFSIAEDLGALSEALDQVGDTRLVIIDPISAYLGDIDSHVNAQVRGVMGPLASLADKHRCAFLGLSHLNKSWEGSAIYRISGSLAFVALARSAFLLARDREQPERRRLLRIKNNLSPLRTGMAFSLISNESGLPVLAWEPEPVDLTANDVLSPTVSEKGETKVEVAERWLKAELADGPVLGETIEKDAKGLGISVGTLRRAKKSLGVEPAKRTYQGQYEWFLPTHSSICASLTEPVPDKASSNDAHCAPLTESKREAERRSAPGNNFPKGDHCAPLDEPKQNEGSVNDAQTSPGVGDNDYEEVFE